MTKHSPFPIALLFSLLHATALTALSPTNAPASAPTKPFTPTDNNPGATDIASILTQTNSFNIFLRLMKTTQLINQLNSQLITIKSGGLTILAPEDGAFSELPPGFLNTLSDGQKLKLVQFHVLPDFISSASFDTLTNPVRTLAGNKPGKVELDVISYGGSVNISTGQVNTTINGIVYMDKHLAVYKVGKVLLPSEFFPTKNKTIVAAPTLPPAPVTETARAPEPAKVKPPSSEESSGSSTQVVPTVTSGGMRISGVEPIVLGVVFLRFLGI